MNCNHHINIDPAPKRRKSKDNPYLLFFVGINTEHPHYFVRFKDSTGQDQCIEITSELFQEMNGFELEDLSYLNEVDNHYEHSELTDATLTRRSVQPQANVEETVFLRLEKDELHRALELLPEVQRRRVELYYFENYTYEQIGHMEGCSHPAVIKSIKAALNNLEKIFSE